MAYVSATSDPGQHTLTPPTLRILHASSPFRFSAPFCIRRKLETSALAKTVLLCPQYMQLGE